MQASIIIRVKNESENLKKLFEILKNQTYQDFEIVIVDNNSTDGSDKVAFNYFRRDRICIVKIDKFSYPKACNLGARKAKGKYLVYLSAHSYPINETWLADGLSDFDNEKVAGVFAWPTVKIFQSSIAEMIGSLANMLKSPKKSTMRGEIGNTNSIIRRSLWEKHKFDENLVSGSEDYEWSMYWKSQGYLIINDPRFRVYHSHHRGFLEVIKQQKEWKKQREKINKKFTS